MSRTILGQISTGWWGRKVKTKATTVTVPLQDCKAAAALIRRLKIELSAAADGGGSPLILQLLLLMW